VHILLADEIAATWQEVLAFESLFSLDHLNLTFNMGLSGTAFVLAQVWQATYGDVFRGGTSPPRAPPKG
jgi:hypothetical protein